jgi:hypothetical protein
MKTSLHLFLTNSQESLFVLATSLLLESKSKKTSLWFFSLSYFHFRYDLHFLGDLIDQQRVKEKDFWMRQHFFRTQEIYPRETSSSISLRKYT